ncbi:MAG: DUF4139 domain-containing protein [Methanotrichaceae archaeon]|nr:DUF4139 domain-containing protein [Methanotrichaceae archaeon]
MRLIRALLAILICTPILICSPIHSQNQESIEATTTLMLPLDSVTIYPSGMVYAKRLGSLDVTEGVNKFVINVPQAADKNTLLLSIDNASIERVVYNENPVYSLNFSSAGKQDFAMSYLMYGSGYWEPRYDLELENDSMDMKARAVIRNNGGEDFKGVKLRLVSGLPQQIVPYESKRAGQMQLAFAPAAASPEESQPLPEISDTGTLETLYVFELDGRNDVETDKEISLPLLDGIVPLVRIFNWNAYENEDGPVLGELRANNTMVTPWPAGKAQIHSKGDYVTSFDLPYTPAGTNASIILGPTADLKVSKKLKDYNSTENIKEVKTSDNQTHALKETIENWTYELKITSNIDRPASLEINDIKPKDAVMLVSNYEPSETTATSLKWNLTLEPRSELAIGYSYQIKTTIPIES